MRETLRRGPRQVPRSPPIEPNTGCRRMQVSVHWHVMSRLRMICGHVFEKRQQLNLFTASLFHGVTTELLEQNEILQNGTLIVRMNLF